MAREIEWCDVGLSSLFTCEPSESDPLQELDAGKTGHFLDQHGVGPGCSLRKREVRWTVSPFSKKRSSLIHVNHVLGISDDSVTGEGPAGMRSIFTAVASATCLAAVSLGTALSAGEARTPSTYMYLLMVDVIGPAANSLWAAAGTPALSEQDWMRLKQMTARLTETANSVSFGGTTTVDVDRAKSSEWKAWAGKYTDTLSLAANAVERKDKAAFVAAADGLVDVCQGCHAAFPQAAQ